MSAEVIKSDTRRCPECGREIAARLGEMRLSAGGVAPAKIYECSTRADDGKSHWIRTERAVRNGPA